LSEKLGGGVLKCQEEMEQAPQDKGQVQVEVWAETWTEIEWVEWAAQNEVQDLADSVFAHHAALRRHIK